ncbi:MAG: hypothetical protein WC360_05155 [Opitutales bacterium]|jgi:hypothetical protein
MKLPGKSLGFLACGILLVLSGCATNSSFKVLRTNEWHKTAFVSASGNNLHATKIGTTVFNNEFVQWYPQGQDLDALLSDAVEPVLMEFIHSEFVRDPADVDTLRQAQTQPFSPSAPFVLPQDYVSALLANGFDSLVVAFPTKVNLSQQYDPHWYSGVGMMYRSFLNLHSTYAVVAVELRFYDLEHPEIPPASSRIYVEDMLEDFPWHTSWDEYTPEQKQFLLDSIIELVSDKLPEEVRRKLEPYLQAPAPQMGAK